MSSNKAPSLQPCFKRRLERNTDFSADQYVFIAFGMKETFPYNDHPSITTTFTSHVWDISFLTR